MNPLRRKLLREIGRRKGQFAAIVLTGLLGTALFGASFDAWRNLQASYDQAFVELHLADFTLVGGGAQLASPGGRPERRGNGHSAFSGRVRHARRRADRLGAPDRLFDQS